MNGIESFARRVIPNTPTTFHIFDELVQVQEQALRRMDSDRLTVIPLNARHEIQADFSVLPKGAEYGTILTVMTGIFALKRIFTADPHVVLDDAIFADKVTYLIEGKLRNVHIVPEDVQKATDYLLVLNSRIASVPERAAIAAKKEVDDWVNLARQFRYNQQKLANK